jgi:ATP-dependent protease ClpP protease subunit
VNPIRDAWRARCEAGHKPAVRAEAADGVGVLYLYDPIDEWFGVTAKDFVIAVDQLGDVDTIQLHVNSPGGDVFDAVAIANTLRAHKADVHAIVDGLAASSASFIAAAADRLTMMPNSTMMIHDAWTIAIGDADTMREAGDLLDRTSDNIASIYAAKAGGDAADWRATMKAEAWYSPAEAVDAGLADDTGELPDDAAQLADVVTFPVAAIPTTAHNVAAAAVAASIQPKGNTSMNPTPDVAATAPAAGAAADTSPAAAPPAIGDPTASRRPSASIKTLDQFYAAMTQRAAGGALPELRNALEDITQSSVGVDLEQPDFVGELWSGVRYQRRIVPLIKGPNLTSFTLKGWRWTTKPVMAAYAGDKADVPSNVVGTEPASASAVRLAGAHDIDRKFVDFPDDGFFAAYYAAMAESYARLSDAAAAAAIIAGATDVALPAYEGFLGAIAAGVAAIDADTGAGTTFVLANPADLIPFVLATTSNDLPARLQMIGVDLDRIQSSTQVPAGHVIVGNSAAIVYRELGDTPIRVQAINVAQGGVDAGVFGYYATQLQDSGGIQDVVIDTGA